MTKKKKQRSQLNFIVSSLVALAALLFFAYLQRPEPAKAPEAPDDMEPVEAAGEPVRPPGKTEAASKAPGSTNLPGVGKVVELSPEMAEQTKKTAIQLPPDLKAQLEAQPPELPDDLKAQLAGPPRNFLQISKRSLKPPQELPEDMKRALKTPPRVVTLEEVNTPPETGR